MLIFDDTDLMLARGKYSTEKTCNRCKESQPLTSFTKDVAKKDGLRTICKACTALTYKRPEALKRTAARVAELRKTEKWKAYNKVVAKEWRKTEKGKAYRLVSNRKMANEHPERLIARRRVETALRSGRLTKWPCFCCGEEIVEAHHPDYSRPLDVVWLCKTHHGEIHYALPD